MSIGQVTNGSPASTPVAVASPAAAASPAPKKGTSFLGRGPIVLSGTGNLQLGLNRYSRNDVSSQFDQVGGGFTIGAERRTEQSVFSVSNSLGYSTGNTSIGQIIVGYRTPKYALSYGQISSSSDSQLNLGGFAKGLAATVPLRHGQLSALGSVVQRDSQATLRVFGVRRTTDVKDGTLTLAGFAATAEHASGAVDIGDIVYRHSSQRLSTTSEVAISHTRGLSDSPDGNRLAFDEQADVGVGDAFTAVQVRYLPAGFSTLQSETAPIFQADLVTHRELGLLGTASIDLDHIDQRPVNSVATHTNLIATNFARSIGSASVSVNASYSRAHDNVNDDANAAFGVNVSEQLHGFGLNQSVQINTANGTQGSSRQNQFTFSVGHALLGGSANFESTINTSMQGGGGGSGSQFLNAFTYIREFGRKTDITGGYSVQRSLTDAIAINQYTSEFGVVRRFSPVIALRVGVTRTLQTGYGGGVSNAFTADIVAPLAFGSAARVGGRANPNLPATIHGSVTKTPLQSSPFALSSSTVTSGYNNVLVILDGKISQRTDSNGEFEFSFIKPGQHTVSLETATIAPGLIADRDSQTITVQGGQRAELNFAVGNFAGVAGVVTVKKNGVDVPLAGVGVSIDGTQAATTDPNGKYSVGKLTPGAHKVSLVQTTLPATVTFDEFSKPASVAYGTSTKVNFSGVSLGSITGLVLAPGGNGFGDLMPAANIYVVANPGDHASITGDDGVFYLDNLPPGSYTLSVDKDSLPDDLSVISGPDGEVTVAGNDVTGIIFKLGAAPKEVVFTFSNGKKQVITADVTPASAPPGAILHVSARTQGKVSGLAVESDVFGSFPLTFDKAQDAWVGTALVPNLNKGSYSLAVTAHAKNITDGQALVLVDPAIPIATMRVDRSKALPGHTVHVTLKTLGPIAEGDTLRFEDGYTVKLPKEKNGIFAFDVRVWSKGLPYKATLAGKRGVSYTLSLR